MDKILKFLNKYWFIISLCGTLTSTLITEAWYLMNRIEKAEVTIATLNDWVADHDDTLSNDSIRLSKLEEDERLRELGLLK